VLLYCTVLLYHLSWPVLYFSGTEVGTAQYKYERTELYNIVQYSTPTEYTEQPPTTFGNPRSRLHWSRHAATMSSPPPFQGLNVLIGVPYGLYGGTISLPAWSWSSSQKAEAAPFQHPPHRVVYPERRVELLARSQGPKTALTRPSPLPEGPGERYCTVRVYESTSVRKVLYRPLALYYTCTVQHLQSNVRPAQKWGFPSKLLQLIVAMFVLQGPCRSVRASRVKIPE
jgi:hypothetical protein